MLSLAQKPSVHRYRPVFETAFRSNPHETHISQLCFASQSTDTPPADKPNPVHYTLLLLLNSTSPTENALDTLATRISSFRRHWPHLARDTSASAIRTRLSEWIPAGRSLYVASNEANQSFFDELRRDFKVAPRRLTSTARLMLA
jgi:hypothetical protein